MPASSDRDDGETAKGTSEIAEEARAHLTRLHQEVVEAEELVVSTNAAQLLEANEHLVISTLRAQTDAETSTRELKEAARSIERDPLTELPNRALLLDRFRQAILDARRNSTLLALLFLDLDNFKQINDTLGHAAGDQALKRAARCLVSAIRAGDTVSRHGGDEFLILLAGVSQPSDAVLVAEKAIAALAVPSPIGKHVLGLTASIGISVYPTDGEDTDTLIDRADSAMYFAKKHAVGSFALHGQEPASKGSPKSRRSPGPAGPGPGAPRNGPPRRNRPSVRR